jgi:serine/threonine protein kinase
MIVDDLTLEKLIGKGSFGEVYLTSKKGDDKKKYATKKIERAQVEKGEGLKYLKNEIVILSYLKHPNIAKFVEVKKTKKHYYIVMEFCNGGELSKALEKYMEKNGKPFPEEIVQHFMKQIMDAFKYMHERKIIHRDVKLDNILISYDTEEDKQNFNLMKAQAKIIDFGFSCRINKSGLQYTTLGSPINMDPLILKKLGSSNNKTRQLGYGQKADIWSLGTICYEMLIGKTAFDEEDMADLFEKIESGKYIVPTTLSHEAISFLNGMLQYDGKNRLTAEQLYKHDFLTKDVKDFKFLNLKKENLKQSILVQYGDSGEIKFMNKAGCQLMKIIYEKEEHQFVEKKKQGTKNNLCQLPSKRFPDNQAQHIGVMTQEKQNDFGKEVSVQSYTNSFIFSYSSGIFDS